MATFKGSILGQGFNDSRVVGVTKKADIFKQLGGADAMDSRKIRAANAGEDERSLGLIELWENAQIVKVPFLKDLFKSKDIIYVNGFGGSFKYDLAMDVKPPCVLEHATPGDYPGIDGTPFEIKLNHKYGHGDVLTYDPIDGEQVIVTDDEIIDEGDGFVHTVTLSAQDPEAWFPPSKLKEGTEIYKIDNITGEYDTQFGGVSPYALDHDKVTLRYTMGDPRSTMVSWSTMASQMKVGEKASQGLTNQLQAMRSAFGDNDLFFFGQMKGKKLDPSSVQVIDLMEGLALAEFYKITATSLMFSKGMTVTGRAGAAKLRNEGLYHQLRRGNHFTYSNEAELRRYIQTAANVIYHGTTIPVEHRQLKFKCGFDAYNLVREMFDLEFKNTTPVTIDQEALNPHRVLSGTDRYNLKYESYAIGSAFLNGIGQVEIEHDPTLDYDFGDYVARGYQAGRTRRSWSLVMWDVTDSMYSNVLDKKVLPEGVTIDQRASANPNLYMVKAEGIPEVNFSTRPGIGVGQGATHANTYFGDEFVVWGGVEAWMPDKGRAVMIEKAVGA